jgi:hypothetical protein
MCCKKYFLIWFAVFATAFLSLKESDLKIYRTYYFKAIDSSEYADKLVSITEGKSDNLSLAYQGSGLCFQASHHLNPVKKWKLLNEGLDMINKAVLNSPDNFEIRLIRWSIESNIPGFLSVKKHLKEDEQFILENFEANHPMAKLYGK